MSLPGAARADDATRTLLGGLSVEAFLRDHWQKKPLLVRQALPGFRGLVSADELLRLAGKRDAVARAVSTAPATNARDRHGRRRPRYQLEHGPLRHVDLGQARQQRWTFLVQGVERHVPAAWDLLARFSFLPWSRIDDLMISWAAPGGGVGPHVDDYDVFLLQGPGRRRWQIGASTGYSLDPDEELKILKDFRATDDWTLEPGDMLYLPPGVPHWGTAVDECMTYSIGFLAPRHEQLTQNFLAYLAQKPSSSPSGIYSDANLGVSSHPGEVGDDAVARVEQVLRAVVWDGDDVGVFLGRLLTGPKVGVDVERPRRPLAPSAFSAAVTRPGLLRVAPTSRLLFRGDRVFVDGEVVTARGALRAVLVQLADTRRAALPVALSVADVEVLYALHTRGALVVDGAPGEGAPRSRPRERQR
jgi:50S ribosomal protein L16 3-hydroxylase